VLLPDSERPPAGLDATRLGQERLVVVEARRGRARAFGLASLVDAGWILNPEGYAARALLQRALLAANLRLRVAVETYTYELQLSPSWPVSAAPGWSRPASWPGARSARVCACAASPGSTSL
jgi:hypothetical protein